MILRGEKFTVAGYLLFLPPGTPLELVQSWFPGFLVRPGWDAEVVRQREADLAAQHAQDMADTQWWRDLMAKRGMLPPSDTT